MHTSHLRPSTFSLQLKCCGAYLNGPEAASNNSWTDSGAYPVEVLGKKFVVPASCCDHFEKDSDKESCRMTPRATAYNVTGCFDKLDQTFQDNKSTFLITGVVIMVIMVNNNSNSWLPNSNVYTKVC